MNKATTSAPRWRGDCVYLAAQLSLGAGVLLWALVNWECADRLRFLAFLAAALIGSVLKVNLPHVKGTASVNALFILTGVVDLSRSEAIVIAALALATQCLWRPKQRPRAIQVLFSVSTASVSVYLASQVYALASAHVSEPLALSLVTLVYFFANTFSIACIIALTERRGLAATWKGSQWVLAYYGIGASLAWIVAKVPTGLQWQIPIVGLPAIYLVYRSNRTHLAQMETEKEHVEEMNALHLRTIEALALAIDAKDHTTHDHLQRVQHYAIEVGKELGLSETELEALRAASVLHDIGKLAVPEHIISKPGKLTPAEFEKMKIHPVVGAEILQRVDFPYPVTPIVRSHHEKWDGGGYPDGLKGEEIPIGARILAAVDCLDALASDRQYRRALPLDEAMAKVASESGTSFDPAVVRVLEARYVELEAQAKAIKPALEPALSTDVKITRGAAPAAGFQTGGELTQSPSAVPNLHLPALDAAESASQALAIFAEQIRPIVAFDAFAYYALEAETLLREFVAGEAALLPDATCIPSGQGMIGWVAGARQPLVNGNPAVDPSAREGVLTSKLQSSLAIPLAAEHGLIGVLALYRIPKDAFLATELAVLLSLSEGLVRRLSRTNHLSEAAA